MTGKRDGGEMKTGDFEGLREVLKRRYEAFGYGETLDYIREFCQEERKGLLSRAELLQKQVFSFRDRWDMEPCPTPFPLTLRDWVTSPNGDPEWVYMLNRQDFLPRLWQAYLVTGKKDYVDKLFWYLWDWMEKNPVSDQATEAFRTIDTGIRCMNWCALAVDLAGAGLMEASQAECLLGNIGQQLKTLRERYIGKYTLSNWGVLQTTAVCAGYLWFRDFLPGDGLEEWAWEELREQLELQVLEDGSHWEQSALYHVEVLNACTRLLVYAWQAKKAGVCLGKIQRRALGETGAGEPRAALEGWLVRAVLRMSRHVLYSSDPNRMQLPQGDSDVTDVRDVMVRAAVISCLFPAFGQEETGSGGIYRFAGGRHMDMDSAWLLGISGIRSYESLRPKEPQSLSWFCEDSGNLYLRNSWGKQADFTWMANGCLGSSHGHANQAQLCFHHKGRPFLTDSGRYSYREDEPLRCRLKSPQAHNVCVIDGQSGGEPDGSWSYASFGENLKNYFREQGDVHYMEMPVRGTLRDKTPYLIVRRVMVADAGIWLSVQDVMCRGKHRIREYFHLDSRVRAEKTGEGMRLTSGEVCLNAVSPEPFKTEECLISRRYNEKSETLVLVKECEMEDRLTFSALFLAEGMRAEPAQVFVSGCGEPVSGQRVTGWDICTEKGERWTLLVWNRETCRGGKMYLCHGVPVYGKAVVLKEAEGKYTRIRLKS